MKPLASLDASAIHSVLFDIDETLTTEGKLTAEAYTALEALHRAGRRTDARSGADRARELDPRQWLVRRLRQARHGANAVQGALRGRPGRGECRNRLRRRLAERRAAFRFLRQRGRRIECAAFRRAH